MRAVGPEMQVAPAHSQTQAPLAPPAKVATGLRTPLANKASNPELARHPQNQASGATGDDMVLFVARVVACFNSSFGVSSYASRALMGL